MSDSEVRLVTDMADEAIARAFEKKREMFEVAAAAKEANTKTNKAIHAFGGEAKIFDLVASGQTIESLCGTVGISCGSFYDWLEKVPSRAESLARARARGARPRRGQMGAHGIEGGRAGPRPGDDGGEAGRNRRRRPAGHPPRPGQVRHDDP